MVDPGAQRTAQKSRPSKPIDLNGLRMAYCTYDGTAS